MHVHHKNEDRSDPSPDNLEIIDPHEHYVYHNRGENNSTAKFKEKDVRRVCKMLVKGISHKKIAKKMTKELGVKITVDSIDKIANGSNWTEITKDYHWKHEHRETMNGFSDHRIDIARMRYVEGLSNMEIAKHLGVEYKSKSYTRLVGCIPRYVDNYINGKYGLFYKQK